MKDETKRERLRMAWALLAIFHRLPTAAIQGKEMVTPLLRPRGEVAG